MQERPADTVLVINAGSSSIKFALFSAAPALLWRGAVSGIGTSASRMAVAGDAGTSCARQFAIPDHVTAARVLEDWLREHLSARPPQAVVHRLVHGGPGYEPTCVLDRTLINALYGAASSQPEHLPQELHLIDTLRRRYPAARQLACFDSSFHATMPPVAAMLPIPRQYFARGVRRYGFHGLSCAWLMGELARVAGPAATGRVVIAHLGGGASVTAVNGGRSCDTSMGLTPAGGIMSGKRPGDLDPGLAWHLARSDQMTLAGFQHMVNHESGLLGVSGTSADLALLLGKQAHDSRAAEAVAMFCYQVRKAIWAMAGAMDGMDTLIFSGGIGEHADSVRARVCAGLAGLGVVLDQDRNAAHAALISAPASTAAVRVMGSDEESMMAAQATAWLAAHAADGEGGA